MKKGKDLSNGKLSDAGANDDEKSNTSAIPDARLFATWDYETKDYRVPLGPGVLKKGRTSSTSMSVGHRPSISLQVKPVLPGMDNLSGLTKHSKGTKVKEERKSDGRGR